MKTIAITGVGGFIGGALFREYSNRARVVPIVRRAEAGVPGAVAVGDIGAHTDWRAALRGVDVVIHCAGRAHILNETSQEPLAAFRQVNRDGTLALAQAASACGVQRFVFLSSVAVMGRPVAPCGLITDDQVPAPVQDYAVSKLEAELGLDSIGRNTGMEIVIVRPPLVYGPGAPANFKRLLTLVKSGMPLPLGHARAKRSFVGIGNLADMLWASIEIPEAAGGRFFVSDGEDISTADLIRRIAFHMNRKPLLLPVPLGTLRLAGRLIGRAEDVCRLLDPLRVNIEKTCRTLDWRPARSIDTELARTVSFYDEDRVVA